MPDDQTPEDQTPDDQAADDQTRDGEQTASGAHPVGGVPRPGPLRVAAASVLGAVAQTVGSIGATVADRVGSTVSHPGRSGDEPVGSERARPDRVGSAHAEPVDGGVVLGADLGRSSRGSLLDLFAELDRVESGEHAADLDGLGDQLRSVAALSSREPAIRRSLTDASREAPDRAALAHRLLDGRVTPAAADVVAAGAAGRWSAPRDLVDALDLTATAAEVAAADRAGQLDSLEDDLFRFSRIVAGNAALRDALTDRTSPTDARAGLVHRLLDERTGAAAVRLAVAAATDLRSRSVELALEEDGQVIASRRNRAVALVRVAGTLTDAQRERLSALLARQAGRPVQLNVVHDPSLIGGFRAEVGETVLDASVLSRLSEARRRLAG